MSCRKMKQSPNTCLKRLKATSNLGRSANKDEQTHFYYQIETSLEGSMASTILARTWHKSGSTSISVDPKNSARPSTNDQVAKHSAHNHELLTMLKGTKFAFDFHIPPITVARYTSQQQWNGP